MLYVGSLQITVKMVNIMPKIPKITKEQFIYAIVNNIDNKNTTELATELGVSVTHFNNLRKKYKILKKDHLKEIAQEYSLEQIANLRKSANDGNVKAMGILLELAELYDPRSKVDDKGQMQIHFHVSGLDIPKNAGLSSAVIPERTGKEVVISEEDYQVIQDTEETTIDKEAEEW